MKITEHGLEEIAKRIDDARKYNVAVSVMNILEWGGSKEKMAFDLAQWLALTC